jgi:hypothetical protein
VDLLAHSIAERLVDPLVTLDAGAPFELGRDDGREEVAAVALDGDMLAGQPTGNIGFEVGRGGIGHDAAILAWHWLRARHGYDRAVAIR